MLMRFFVGHVVVIMTPEVKKSADARNLCGKEAEETAML